MSETADLELGMPLDRYMTVEFRLSLEALLTKPRPTIIVEGEDDIDFIYRLVKHSTAFQDGSFFVVYAGSKGDFFAYKKSGELTFPYCVLLDRDHDPELGKLDPAPEIIYTHFYCMESYLVRERVVQGLVDNLADLPDAKKFDYSTMFEVMMNLMQPFAVISLLKATRQGEWLTVSCEKEKIWQVADRNSMSPVEERATQWLSAVLSSVCTAEEPLEIRMSQLSEALEDLRAMSREQLLCTVSGKQLLEVMYHYFVAFVPSCMVGGKGKEIFFADLCGQLIKDASVVELLRALEEKAWGPILPKAG